MKKVYVKEDVCIGCGLCEVYCKTEHSPSKDLIKAFKRESPPALLCLYSERKGLISFPVQCRQCTEPYCVYACLSGALQRDQDSGIITVDEERCIGCWTCVLACPFGAVRQDTQQKRIAKCDLCPDREMPVCVANCPNEALVYAEEQGSPALVP